MSSCIRQDSVYHRYLLIITALFLIFQSTPGYGDPLTSDRSADQDSASGEEYLCKTGSYLREIFFFDLYRVTLYTAQPSAIAAAYLDQPERPELRKITIDSLADFLLDPHNSIPVELSIRLCRDVSCSRQKKMVRDLLERAGYPVDEQWNLVENQEHQEEVRFLADAILGTSGREGGRMCRKLKKGDRIILALTGKQATVEYVPTGGNGPQKGELPSSQVIRSIMATYLSKRLCIPKLRNKLPDALLGSVVSFCRNLSAEKTHHAGTNESEYGVLK